MQMKGQHYRTSRSNANRVPCHQIVLVALPATKLSDFNVCLSIRTPVLLSLMIQKHGVCISISWMTCPWTIHVSRISYPGKTQNLSASPCYKCPSPFYSPIPGGPDLALKMSIYAVSHAQIHNPGYRTPSARPSALALTIFLRADAIRINQSGSVLFILRDIEKREGGDVSFVW